MTTTSQNKYEFIQVANTVMYMTSVNGHNWVDVPLPGISSLVAKILAGTGVLSFHLTDNN